MYFVHIVLKLTSLLHGHTQNLSFSLLQLRVRIFIENNLLLDSVLDHFLRTPHVIEHFSYIFTKRIDKKTDSNSLFIIWKLNSWFMKDFL